MNGGLHKLLLVAHLMTAIVGFGAVYLNGIYGAESKKRKGSEGLAVLQANHRVSTVGEWIIYTVPIFGILLVVTSDKAFKFSQTWIWLALLLYLVGIGVSHGVMIPTVKKMEATMEELNALGPPPAGAPVGPPAQVAVMESLGQRLAIGGTFLDVLLIVIVALMVWKPGFP
jgi:uncharacterized membrane protein